jgi:hypothetical protein
MMGWNGSLIEGGLVISSTGGILSKWEEISWKQEEA